jgi:hypothetical protein
MVTQEYFMHTKKTFHQSLQHLRFFFHRKRSPERREINNNKVIKKRRRNDVFLESARAQFP